MFRRDLLGRTATLSTLGAISVSGCLESDTDDEGDTDDVNDTDSAERDDVDPDEGPDASETDGRDDEAETALDSAEWVHDLGGTVETVADGLVLGREAFVERHSDGGIFALEAGTGEHQWTFGKSGGLSSYTDLAVDDAIYAGWGDDALGNGTGSIHAIEFDGTERWGNDIGSVYHRPRLANGAVYVGSDDGVVRAFETADGSERWATDFSEDEIEIALGMPVAAVDDSVIVTSGTLIALDPADGGVRWRYGDPDDGISDATVRDGVVYAADRDAVVALEAGDRRWRTPFEHNRWIRGVTADRVIVKHQSDLYGLDAATGNEQWVVENEDRTRVAVHDETMYVASSADGARIRAIDLEDGDERWTTQAGSGEPVRSLQIVEHSNGTDHSLYVETDDPHLHEVTADGEVVWSESLAGNPRSFVTDGTGRVVVGTETTVYAIGKDT